MPGQAPVYGDLKVATRALDTPLVNPGIASADAFGASAHASGAYIGQGVAGAALGVAEGNRIRQQEQDKRDETDAMDALNTYMDKRNKDMSTYLAKTGKNAVGLSDEARTGHEKTRDEVSGALKNPAAKELFSHMTAKRWTDENRVVTGHEVGQVKEYQVSTFQGAIKRVQQDAIDSGDSKQIQAAASQQYATRLRLADITGEDPQNLELQHRDDSNQLYGGHVQNLLSSGDYKGAADYYEANKDQLHGAVKDSLGERVKVAGRTKTAQTYGDLIMRDPGQTRARAYAQVGVIEDPEIRNLTRVNVDRVFGERTAAKNEAQGSTYEDYAQRIDSGEPLADIISKDSRWSVLDQQDRDKLRHVERNYIEQKQPPALSDDFLKIRNSASELPQEFMAHDFRKDRGHITEHERGQLIELQADLKAKATTKGGPDIKPVHGLLSIEDVANDTLRGIGVNPSLVKGEMDPRATNFKRLLNKAVIAQGGTEKLNSIQMQAIADKLVIEHTEPDKAGVIGKVLRTSTFGLAGLANIGVDGTKKVRLMDAANADKMAFSAEQIPRDSWSASVKALVKAGVPDPTPDEILEHYNGHLSNESK